MVVKVVLMVTTVIGDDENDDCDEEDVKMFCSGFTFAAICGGRDQSTKTFDL